MEKLSRQHSSHLTTCWCNFVTIFNDSFSVTNNCDSKNKQTFFTACIINVGCDLKETVLITKNYMYDWRPVTSTLKSVQMNGYRVIRQ